MSHPVDEFVDKMRDYYRIKDIAVKQWSVSSRRSNVFELKSLLNQQSVLVYIKFSTRGENERCWWSLNVNVLKSIQKSKHEWVVVLLDGNEHKEQIGYILNSEFILNSKRFWRLIKNEYKLHDKDVRRSRIFGGVEDFNRILFSETD